MRWLVGRSGNLVKIAVCDGSLTEMAVLCVVEIASCDGLSRELASLWG